jgi:hemerythrin-like domain-containing protein
VNQILSAAPASTLDRPLEHLRACHRRIEDRLATLERAAAGFPSHPSAALAAIANCLAFFRTSGQLHTRDEEESLFPRLLPLLEGADRDFLAALGAQHEESARLHSALESAAADLEANGAAGALEAFREAVQALASLYGAHIAAEDSRLSPLAQRLLPSGDWKAIAAEMRSRRA